MGAEIFQAVSAGKAAIDGFNLLTQYVNEVKDASKRSELIRIIGELDLKLAETQKRLSVQILENNELNEQVVTLKKKVEVLENPNSTLTIKDGVYYNSENDGPFCTGCYDSKNQKIRLTEMYSEMRLLCKYKCPICGAKYGQCGD
jgi:hypothetical protein